MSVLNVTWMEKAFDLLFQQLLLPSMRKWKNVVTFGGDFTCFMCSTWIFPCYENRYQIPSAEPKAILHKASFIDPIVCDYNLTMSQWLNADSRYYWTNDTLWLFIIRINWTICIIQSSNCLIDIFNEWNQQFVLAYFFVRFWERGFFPAPFALKTILWNSLSMRCYPHQKWKHLYTSIIIFIKCH